MSKSFKPNQAKKNLGAVYTPQHLSIWLARHLKELGCDPSVILDPAAGTGALLEGSNLVFPKALLKGYEIDQQAHAALVRSGWASGASYCDALLIKDWFADSDDGCKLIFSNPPWGAKINEGTSKIYKHNFQAARGSFDIFDLFVEKTIKTLNSGDWAALFLPDSLLLENHSETRRMIHNNVLVHSITRLPEGIFPGVNMGSMAVVIQKVPVPVNHKVKFSRIGRLEYFSGNQTYSELEDYRSRNEIDVKQSTWIESSAANWHGGHASLESVSLPSDLINHSSEKSGSSWDLWFTSGRGLEIGKKQLVKGYPLVSVSDQMIPIVVGEDVNRRSVHPSRLMNLSEIKGLRLKNEFVPGKRLLVRKTGIGIKAAVAEDVVTTQTVYHFRLNEQAPHYALHYAAGFLTSRVLIAIHLAKTGETEWRSHPYVTQKVIRDLQLPIPNPGSVEERIAINIAQTSELLHLKADAELEDLLDHLVAELLGRGDSLVRWAINFLESIEGCSYTKLLSTGLRPKKTA